MRLWSQERHCSAWLSWCLIGAKVGKAEMANLQGFFQVVFFFPHSNTLVKSEKRDQQITCVCLLLSICAQKHSNPSWCTIYQEFNASKFVVFTSLLLFSILFTLQLDRVLCYHEHNHQHVSSSSAPLPRKDWMRLLSRTAAITIFEQDNLCTFIKNCSVWCIHVKNYENQTLDWLLWFDCNSAVQSENIKSQLLHVNILLACRIEIFIHVCY